MFNSFFTKIAKVWKYLGHYTGKTFEIIIADMYTHQLSNHNQCSGLFQKFIHGIFCTSFSGLSSNSSFKFDSVNKKFTLIVPSYMLESFEICRFEFFSQLAAIQVLENLKKADSTKNIIIDAKLTAYAVKVKAYFTAWDANSNKENVASRALLKDVILFNLENSLNDDQYFQSLIVANSNYIIKHLESIKEKPFNYDFIEATTAAASGLETQPSVQSNSLLPVISTSSGYEEPTTPNTDSSQDEIQSIEKILGEENKFPYSIAITVVTVEKPVDNLSIGTNYIDFLNLGNDSGFDLENIVISTIFIIWALLGLLI